MQNRPVTAPDDPWRGRRYLTQVQYADDSNLAARQSIYAFQRPRIDLFSWALDLAGIRGPETVLDVGCGNGNYLARLGDRQHQGLLVGLDLSVGMLTAAANRARRAGKQDHSRWHRARSAWSWRCTCSTTAPIVGRPSPNSDG